MAIDPEGSQRRCGYGASLRGVFYLKLETGGSQDFLCHCFHRSLAELRAEIIRLNLKSVNEVYQKLLQGGACRSCAEDIQKLLDETWSRARSTRRPT